MNEAISAKSSWIFLTQIAVYCERCGAREMFERGDYGPDITKIHAQVNAFADLHERCAATGREPPLVAHALPAIIDLAASFLRTASMAQRDGDDRKLRIALKDAREQILRAEAILSGAS